MQPPADFAARAGRYTGNYVSTRLPPTRPEKLMALFASALPVVDGKDGTLIFQGRRYVEVEPLRFREVEGLRKLVFVENERGEITHVYGDDPIATYVKGGWYDGVALHLALPILFLALTLATVIDCFREYRRRPPAVRWL